MTDMA